MQHVYPWHFFDYNMSWQGHIKKVLKEANSRIQVTVGHSEGARS